MAKIRFQFKAPRWEKISGLVKQHALYCDLDYNLEVTKGFLTERGTFVGNGTDENVLRFKAKMNNLIEWED